MGVSYNPSSSSPDDEEERRRQQQGGGASGPAATFAQLQRQGYARPAPSQNANPNMMMGPGGIPYNPQRTQQQYTPDIRGPMREGEIRSMDHRIAQDDGLSRNDLRLQRLPPTHTGGVESQPPAPIQYLPGGVTQRREPNVPDPNPTPGINYQQSPFGQHLLQQYSGYQGPGQFNGQAGMVNAPNAYQPGGYNGRYDALSAPELRQSGMFQGGGSSFGGQLQQALMGQLQNPSSFNSDAVQGMFNRLSGQIDDEYTMKDRSLGEEMARRGLSESSIRGGRMADLNVEKRSAKTELADRLLEQMAMRGSQDRQNAISQALGYDQSQFNQGLQGYQANLGANQQNFQQDLMARAFQGDQNAMQLVQNMNVQNFNNQAGQQGFQNQMANAQFNLGQNQQQYQNQLTNFQANLGAGQQGFNQQQALLSSLLGYEQQGWENAFQGSQFEADNDFRNRQLAAAMASLGL